jgi:hypothetical protein
LKSLPQQGPADNNDEHGSNGAVSASAAAATTFDPLQIDTKNNEAERQGALRLANKMYTRIDKANKRDENRKEKIPMFCTLINATSALIKRSIKLTTNIQPRFVKI